MSIFDENTDPNNRWLNNAPTTSDGTDFLAMGMGSGGPGGIDVSPDGVKQFSSRASAEGMDLMGNFADGVFPLAAQVGQIGGSFIEAAYFKGGAIQGMERLTSFQTDAAQGLLALGRGAHSIALNYINGDATSAATMSDVEGAFNVGGGRGYQNAPVDETDDSARSPRGQDAPEEMPTAEDLDDLPQRDPNGFQAISLGAVDSYFVPAVAADDLERLILRQPDVIADRAVAAYVDGTPLGPPTFADNLQYAPRAYGNDLEHQGWETRDDGSFIRPDNGQR